MTWIQQYWQDLQPTPGRLGTSLRIVLATTIALILMMTWQVPAAAYGLYIIFMVARDSPSISMRMGILSVLGLCVAVATVFAIVIATNNDPTFRVLTVPVVAFLAGMAMRATTISNLAVTWGFVVCTLIANWEFHTPAEAVVKNSMWLAGAGTISIGCSVLVEYMFGETNPAARLWEQLQARYQALEKLFTLVANGASAEDVSPASVQLSRLAASGQAPMQELYDIIVDRQLDPGALPIGSRVHISMLAQLLDVSAAFASQHPTVTDPETVQRCAQIAADCQRLASPDTLTPEKHVDAWRKPASTLLDRIEAILHAMLWMPQNEPSSSAKELIALPSNKVPLLIPGGLRNEDNVAFALQLSLCATICYIFYHAVGWPGISTSVTTVFFTALGTSGATKQKLFFRTLGAAIGGLVFGIGCTAFLFPMMDSITSLVVLIAIIAFVAAWCATGRRFSYVGLQIALAFYFVAFQGFGPPQELAPARDRFIGILVALVVMWVVFDQLWPVRTVTVMRRSLASVLRSEASLLRLGENGQLRPDELQQANALRDQVGKIVAGLRSMDDAVEYEFGSDRQMQMYSSHAILRAAFVAVAIFWNQLVILEGSEDEEFLRDPKLIQMRRAFASELNTMAAVITERVPYTPSLASGFFDPVMLDDPRYGEYVRNSMSRFGELQGIVLTLSTDSTA